VTNDREYKVCKTIRTRGTVVGGSVTCCRPGSLETISGFKLQIDIVQNIIKDYTHLANSGKIIILCWVPSHVNIHGNERADTAAKSTPHRKLQKILPNFAVIGAKFCDTTLPKFANFF